MRVSKSTSVFLFFAAAFVSLAILAEPASAKVPGKTYCFNGVCHKVKTIPEMVALVGRDHVFQTSFYDSCKRDRFNPCGLTSSGEVFSPERPDNAASPIYPNGTVLLLRNPSTGDAAVARINNSGPYWGKRKLDVSRALAQKLGFAARGVANIEVRVLSAPKLSETKYKRKRRYAAVPGPIGQFASLDQAQRGTMVAMAFNAMSGSLLAPTAGRLLPAAQFEKVRLAAMGGTTQSMGSDRKLLQSPADGLKDAARRTYGGDGKASKRRVPSSITASARRRQAG
jgi:rare lipoprotein A (peptidoglycan hydrolase)